MRNLALAGLLVATAVSTSRAAEDTEPADPKLLDLLRKALKYDHPDVRARAVSAFVRLGPRAKACARDLAEALVDEKDSSRRRNVAHALVRIGPAAVPEVSALVLVADPKSLRELALAARRAKPAPVGILKALGRCSDPEVQRNVKEALRRVGAGQDTWLPGQLEGMGRQDSASRKAFLQNMGHETIRAEHIPFLIASLKDRDPEVRQLAAALLGKAKPPTKAVAEALFALADDGNMMVMSRALHGLGDMGEISVDYLARALEHRSQNVRMMAAMTLGRIGPAAKGALPALKKAMASGDSNLRVYLFKAEAAITGDSGKAVAKLIETIRKDPGRGKTYNSQAAIARDNALLAIRRMGPAAKDAVPALREIVMKTRFRKNGISTTSRAALSALLAIGRPAADTVLEIVKHPNPEFRKMVNYAMRNQRGKQSALEILIEALQDPAPPVRLWALEALEMPGWGRKIAPAAPYIVRLADDSSPEVQKLVASLLKKSGVSTKDRSKLLKSLRNPDFVVRKKTALTLAKDAVPPDEAIPVLVEILAAKRTTTTKRPHQTMAGETYLALQALAKIGPKARPALGAIRAGMPQWLKGRGSGAALAALDVLEHFVPQSEPQLLLALESRRDTVKQKAAGLLARIGMPVIERLLPKAKDRKLRPGIQDKVVQVATAMGARAVKPLMKHLTGPDETNSSIANYALSGLGTPAVPDLVGLLKSQRSSRSVKVALDCLHDMGAGAKPAVPFVKKYASSPVRDVRWAALSVLAVAGGDDPKAVDILLAALADGDPVIRGNVARILGGSTVAPDRAIPAIAKLLDDPDHRTRSWAIFALGDYGKPALPHLVKAFKDPHEGNRLVVVVFKLAQLGIEALPTLTGALQSQSVEVRETAAEALKRFGPLAVVCYLEAWRAPDQDVRTFAARKLKEMGKVATPALLQMLREKGRR